MGNILIQAMATGEIPSLAELRAIVRASSVAVEYTPRQTREWEGKYRAYQALASKQ
jgi:hypothetical protein